MLTTPVDPARTPAPAPAVTVAGVALAILMGAGAFAVVLAGVPSDFFDLDRHAVPKEAILHATALVTGLIALARTRALAPGVIDLLLAAFGAWTLLSALPATNGWLAFRGAAVTWSGLVLFWTARAIRREGAGSLLPGLLLAAAVTGGLTGLAQAYGMEIGVLAESRAPGGTFGNRNFLAHLMAIVLPVLVLGTAASPKRLPRLLASAGALLVVMALVLTRSRAAWLGAGAGLGLAALVLLLARRTGEIPWRRLRLPAATGMAGLIAALLLPNELSWRSDQPYLDSLRGVLNYREGSGRGRLIQYQNSLSLTARDPILGVGPGNWMVHYPTVTTPGDPSFAGADPIPTNPWPSSDWIAMLTERGIPAVALLLLTGLAGLLVIARRSRAGESPARMASLAGVLGATAVVGLFDAVMLLPIPVFLVSALTGVLLPDSGAVRTWDLAGRRRALALGGLAALSLLATSRSALQWTAIRAAGEGRTVRGAQAGVRYDPGAYRLHLFLGGRGPCARRLPHAEAALRQLPHHQAPRAQVRACRSGQ